MSQSDPSSTLPPTALREFQIATQADWQDGVPVTELLNRVNRVGMGLLPEENRHHIPAARVKRVFTERTFRHYQTLGCIDVPEKHGRRARYGFRHFLQAVLLRKLLWERVSAEQIAGVLLDRTTEELERMLLGGVEIVARMGSGNAEPEPGSFTSPAERWNRVRVAPGVELHLSADLARLRPKELQRLLELMEKALRKYGA